MFRLVRPPLFVALLVAAVLTVVFFSSARPSAAAATAAEIGIAPLGQNSTEYVGIVDQNGASFSYYGYLTYIAGITNTLLFRDPISRTETTARFTFYGTATLTARSVVNNLFNLNGAGTVNFYYDDAQGADFNDPPSFMRGTMIASGTARYHNVLVVTGPNMGIANGVTEMVQTANTPFTLNGQSYQLGRIGLQERFTYNGFGSRLEPTAPRSVTVVAADGQVTGLPTFLPNVEMRTP